MFYRRAIGDRALGALRARTEEGVAYRRLPPTTAALAVMAMPRRFAAWMLSRFHRWSMLPGDVFEDIVRDVVLVVREVRREHVVAVPVSGRLLDAFAADPLRWGPTLTIAGETLPVDALGSPVVSYDEAELARMTVSPCRYSRRACETWLRARAGRADLARGLVER